MKALEKILQDATAGDPITGLKWTRKTSRNLAEELRQKGYKIGHSTISRLASSLGQLARIDDPTDDDFDLPMYPDEYPDRHADVWYALKKYKLARF